MNDTMLTLETIKAMRELAMSAQETCEQIDTMVNSTMSAFDMSEEERYYTLKHIVHLECEELLEARQALGEMLNTWKVVSHPVGMGVVLDQALDMRKAAN